MTEPQRGNLSREAATGNRPGRKSQVPRYPYPRDILAAKRCQAIAWTQVPGIRAPQHIIVGRSRTYRRFTAKRASASDRTLLLAPQSQ